MDNYYHEEARARIEREGIEMEARWGEKERKRKRKSEALGRVARDGQQDETEEKGVGCEHVDLR